MGAQCELSVSCVAPSLDGSQSYLSHFFVVFKMAFLPMLLCENLARAFWRQPDNACSGLRCRNSKWEEQKERGKILFDLFFFWLFFSPSMAQMVSATDHDDSSGSPCLQAEAVTFCMKEFLKPGLSQQSSCPRSSGVGSCQSGQDFVGKPQRV